MIPTTNGAIKSDWNCALVKYCGFRSSTYQRLYSSKIMFLSPKESIYSSESPIGSPEAHIASLPSSVDAYSFVVMPNGKPWVPEEAHEPKDGKDVIPVGMFHSLQVDLVFTNASGDIF